MRAHVYLTKCMFEEDLAPVLGQIDPRLRIDFGVS